MKKLYKYDFWLYKNKNIVQNEIVSKNVYLQRKLEDVLDLKGGMKVLWVYYG